MLTSELQKSLGDVVNTSEKERYPALGLRNHKATDPSEPAGNAAKAWFRGLDPSRRSAIRDLHRLCPSWNLILPLYPALWLAAAAAALATSSWLVWLLCEAVVGVAIHAMATLMHEAIHGTLFRRRGHDRWIGFLLGAPALFSFTAYKVAHLAHHHHTRTPRDPDDFLNVSPNRLVCSIVFSGRRRWRASTVRLQDWPARSRVGYNAHHGDIAMPIHDWSRVPSGLFHDFHQSWSIRIKDALNSGRLPKGVAALVEQRAGPKESDVLAIEVRPKRHTGRRTGRRHRHAATARHADRPPHHEARSTPAGPTALSSSTTWAESLP